MKSVQRQRHEVAKSKRPSSAANACNSLSVPNRLSQTKPPITNTKPPIPNTKPFFCSRRYYNPIPHFGYDLAVRHSPDLVSVPLARPKDLRRGTANAHSPATPTAPASAGAAPAGGGAAAPGSTAPAAAPQDEHDDDDDGLGSGL
eukprot:362855-Chlamydomonas_euryale.AAC.6